MKEENWMNIETQQKLLQKISRRERIEITSGKHHRISFSALFIYSIISASSILLYLYLYGLTWKLIAITGIFSLFFGLLYLICRKMADLAVKGDALLISQFSRPCKVTLIKSVKSIRTRRFLQFSVTSLTFSLDGNKGKVFLLKRIRPEGNKPESIIKFIMDVA